MDIRSITVKKIISFIAGLALSATSYAALYRIDTAELRYDDYLSISIEQAEFYQLSGFIEVTTTLFTPSSRPEFWGISFVDLGLVTDTPQERVFELDTSTGVLSLESSTFSGAPCQFLYAIAGSCISGVGNYETFTGTIDSGSLVLTGSVPVEGINAYLYSITATAVPLPATFWFILSALGGLIGIKRGLP